MVKYLEVFGKDFFGWFRLFSKKKKKK